MATRRTAPSSSQASGKPAPRQSRAPRRGLSDHSTEWGGSEDLDEDPSQFVGTAARALLVLNAFKPGERPLGNAELAERTQLTKPTISRLTYTLARCGYLSFNRRFRVYELGPSAIALGNVALASIDVRLLAKPLMRELAAQANFNVGLGTLERETMIYTDACEGEALVGVRLFPGSHIPVVTSAMGRAYLAGIDPAARDALLALLRPRYGSEWTSLMKGVRKALDEVEKYGFCSSVGEWQKDIHGVAAPIRSPIGGAVYAVNLGGPAYLLPEARLREEHGPRIAALAAKVYAALAPQARQLTDMARDGRG